MKKCVSLMLALMVLFALNAPALADLGEPQFENWYVVCGPSGWDFEDYPYETGVDMIHDHLEPGTRLMVYHYDSALQQYLLVTDDKNFTPKARGFVFVTEEELKNNFFEVNKTIPAEKGTKLAADVKCTVTSDDGVVLRQGPARTFPAYLTVPYQAEIVYRYTYSYGGYNWGYTTYKGQTGWMCIDYTKAITETAAPASDSTTSGTPSTTTPAGTPSTATPADTSTATPSESTSAAPADGTEKADPNAVALDVVAPEKEITEKVTSLMSETSYIILVCCLCAVVVALSAVIIIMIIKRKNQQ